MRSSLFAFLAIAVVIIMAVFAWVQFGRDDGQAPIEVSDTGETFYEEYYELAAGRYELTVDGRMPAEPANFSVSIKGEDYYLLPINVISGPPGPYAVTLDVDVPESGEARLMVGGGGVVEWTLRLELVEPT